MAGEITLRLVWKEADEKVRDFQRAMGYRPAYDMADGDPEHSRGVTAVDQFFCPTSHMAAVELVQYTGKT